MKTYKCNDGTEISYRYPNVAEHFMMKHHCKMGSDDFSGFMAIGAVLNNCSNLITKVEGKHTSWESCLNDLSLSDDLSSIALDIFKAGVTPEEKKS